MPTCKPDQILNPATKRCIKKNGATHKKIMNNTTTSEQKQTKNTKKCLENKVLGPSGRCISINGALYKKLVKQGYFVSKTSTQEHTSSSSKSKPKSSTKNADQIYDMYERDCYAPSDLVTWRLNDSWKEIALWRIVKFDKYCFDILFLIQLLTNQLNSSDYNNPKPEFPKNPFTNVKFTVDELMTIKKRCEDHKLLPITSPLRVYLQHQELFTITSNMTIWREQAIDKLSNHLRYKLIGVTDSQGNFIGFWTKKNAAVSGTEKKIQKWLQTNNKSIYEKIPKDKYSESPPDNYYVFNAKKYS